MTTFHIKLSPQLREDRLRLEKRGSKLVLNGEVFNPTKQDNTSTASQWISGQPEPTDDGWSLTIILPHGSPAPRATRCPEPILVSDDGPVELPPYEGPDEDEEQLRIAVAKKLAKHAGRETTSDAVKIKIPGRLKLGEMPDGVYFSETLSPFAKLPEFGAAVAHVIGTTSLLELEMLRTAVSLHGSESLLAIRTAYALFKNDHQRRAYVEAVARNTGRMRVWEAINWAYTFAKPVFQIRNSFAHHIWGECPVLPNALLLADPMEKLMGQAAHSQLLSHQPAERDAQTLMKIIMGKGGSELSDADSKAIFEIVAATQNNPSKVEAFNLSFGTPLDVHAPAAEIWTLNDFRNATLAANLSQARVLGRLKKVTLWLNGMCSEEDLDTTP